MTTPPNGTSCKEPTPQDKLIQGQLQQLIIKAWTDEQFKESLLNDPKSTAEQFFGLKLPAASRIIANDQTSNELEFPPIYLNIPVKPQMTDEAIKALTPAEFQCLAFSIDVITEAVRKSYITYDEPW